jgi:hypothetical protein
LIRRLRTIFQRLCEILSTVLLTEGQTIGNEISSFSFSACGKRSQPEPREHPARDESEKTELDARIWYDSTQR